MPYHLNGRLQERLDLILGRRQDLFAAGPLQGRLEPLDGLVVVTLVEGVLAQEQAVAGIQRLRTLEVFREEKQRSEKIKKSLKKGVERALVLKSYFHLQ